MKELRIEGLETILKELDKNWNKNWAKLTSGQKRVLSSYMDTTRRFKSNLIIMTAVLWEGEYESFLSFLREMQIEQIVIVSKSSGLFSFLYYLLNNGCTISGAVLIDYKESYCDPYYDSNCTIEGLVLNIK